MTKQFLSAVFSLAMLLSISSCGQNNAKQNNTAQGGLLSAPEFSKQLQNSSDKQVIDVRTPEEFAGGHIKNAENLNFYDSDFQQKIDKLDKNKPVFVYCKGGGRSGKAAAMMEKSGFKTIFDLDGGMMSWTNNNLPVETNGSVKTADKFTPADFEKLLVENKSVLIDYYAPWCAPCKQMEPILAKLKTEFAGKVLVYRINVDEASELSKQLKVEGIPVISAYKNKTEVKRVKGLQSEADLRKLITDLQ